MIIKKPQKKEKYAEKDSFRLSDAYLESLLDMHYMEREEAYRPEKGNRDIGAGSWILIREVPNVSIDVRIEPASVYYAVPALYGSSVGYREDGKYLIVIKIQGTAGVIHDLYLYTHEYIVCTDEIMDAMKEEDVLETMMYDTDTSVQQMDEKLVNSYASKYRDLPEDDKNILDAYQIDGLSFDQACSLYFTERYSNLTGSAIWFKAKPQLRYLFWD